MIPHEVISSREGKPLSETPEEKTKRKLSTLITDHQWTHQYSVFYREIENCPSLISDSNKLKKTLRTKYPESPFLVCYRTLYKKERGGLQAYLTLFSTTKIYNFNKLANKAFESGVTGTGRALDQEKQQRIASAIKNQKLHDLNKYFGQKIRRYSLLNKSALGDYSYYSEPQ